ncbi:hypothetical protein H4R18_000820 [Coemansia javaensis]|uniref:Uncharacterized protein n=1 Tax=Coemansia javaensis TaxID=2761396 RepID=A0A9W8HH54_9FUNG|nr:hypothetical protein H4R18_000820 [Coemansia javaensis]
MDEPLFGGASRRELAVERFAGGFMVAAAVATLATGLTQGVRAGVALHPLLALCVALLAAIEVRLIRWYRRGDLEPHFKSVLLALGAATTLLSGIANMYFFRAE